MGPSRELPPLVISIHGNADGAKRAFAETIAAAKDMTKQLGGFARKYANTRDAQFEREFTAYAMLQRSKEIELKESLRRMAQLDKSAKKQVQTEDKKSHQIARDEQSKAVRFFRTQARSINNDASANYGRLTPTFKGMKGKKNAEGSDLNDLVENATKQSAANAKAEIASAEKAAKARQTAYGKHLQEMHALDKAAKKDVAGEDAAGQKAIASLSKHREAVRQTNESIRGYFEKQNQAATKSDNAYRTRGRVARESFWNEVQQGNQRALKNHYATEGAQTAATERAAKQRTNAINAESRRRNALRGGGEGGGMMGARADMFMHAGALRSIAGGIGDFLKPWAQLEGYIAQIKIFTGDAIKAKAVVAEMQEFALVSPYSLDAVMSGASLLMRYGTAADVAAHTIEMLGDVAGGSSDKLKHLALAFAQTNAMGRLQGQELRQMTEAGFNPLRVAAKHMAGKGASEQAIKDKMSMLDGLMRKRRLDSKFAEKALELATSKGGDYAGAMYAQSQSPIGQATQIVESGALMAVNAAKTLEPELMALLKTTLELAGKFRRWMDANQGVVRSMMIMATRVVSLVIAFHALSAAIAFSKWITGSLLNIYTALINPMARVAGWILLQAAYYGVLGKAAQSAAVAEIAAARAAAIARGGNKIGIAATLLGLALQTGLAWIKAGMAAAWSAVRAGVAWLFAGKASVTGAMWAGAMWAWAGAVAVMSAVRAGVAWLFTGRSLKGVAGGVLGIARAFTMAGWAATAAAVKGAIAWLVLGGPITWTGGAIAGVIAAVVALGLAFFAIGNNNGLTGVLKNIMDYGTFLWGFFANFSQNMPKYFEFIGANWKLVFWDMGVTIYNFISNISSMLYNFFTTTLPKMAYDGAVMAKDAMASLVGMGSSKGWGKQGADGKSGYDTSMLNLDTGAKKDKDGNPIKGGGMFGFLDKYAMPEMPQNIPDAPNVNFEDYYKAEDPSKGGGKKGNDLAAARDHAMVGGNEQAQRMWEYSQAMTPESAVTTKDNAPMKQVALLETIAKNTQPTDARGDELKEAGLTK